MTTLVWDEVGERRYETGVERGVLYLPDGGAVPWNGLTGLTENLGREVKSFYNDGIKYLDHQVIGAFAATLKAFTYPDELEELLGHSAFAPGVFVHDQRPRTFSLSYRTRVGSDLDEDLGYKVHIVYNVLASPGSLDYSSAADSVAPQLFTWELSGVPPIMYGIRPSCHISLHSRSIDPDLLEEIEGFLYGTSTTDPELPAAVDLLGIVESFT